MSYRVLCAFLISSSIIITSCSKGGGGGAGFTPSAAGAPNATPSPSPTPTPTSTPTATPTPTPTVTATPGSPNLGWSSSSTDFGPVINNTDSSTITFTLSNSGTASATSCTAPSIVGANADQFVKVSENCGTADLAASASCQYVVKAHTTSDGLKNATIRRTCNSVDTDIAITVTGTSVNLSLTPATGHDFGSVPVSTTSSTFTFTIQNSGTATATGCSAATLSGANPSEFAIDTDNCASTDRGPSSSCTVLVKASPTGSGVKTATLTKTCTTGGTVSTNANTITVTGTAASLAWSSAATDFGSVINNTDSSTITFTLTNSGAATATNCLAPSIIGSDAGQFAQVSETCGTSDLAASATCQFVMKAHPTSDGLKTATLRRTCGSVNTDIAVTATGAHASIAFSPSSGFAFADTNVGDTSTAQTFAIQNSGTAAATNCSYSLSGTNADQFQLNQGTCSTVSASGSCNMTVQAKPTASGSKSATLSASCDNSVSASSTPLTVNATASCLSVLNLTPTSQNNYNVYTDAVAHNMCAGQAVSITVTIDSNVVIGSTSTQTPSFRVPGSNFFYAGTTVAIVNNGTIIGAGGAAGAAGGGRGGDGGMAMSLDYSVTLTNNGTIAGGGGGGGGGANGCGTTGGAGAAGAGAVAGAGATVTTGATAPSVNGVAGGAGNSVGPGGTGNMGSVSGDGIPACYYDDGYGNTGYNTDAFYTGGGGGAPGYAGGMASGDSATVGTGGAAIVGAANITNAGWDTQGTIAGINNTGATATKTTDVCPGVLNPAPGASCSDGTVYVAHFNTYIYQTTPGGCTDSATPSCNGTNDTVAKTWGTSALSTSGAISPINGTYNTSKLWTLASPAGSYCYNMTYAGTQGWFLPAIQELNLFWQNGPANFSGLWVGASSYYWSSTQVGGYIEGFGTKYTAQAQRYTDGTIPATSQWGGSPKTSNYYVRCMKKF